MSIIDTYVHSDDTEYEIADSATRIRVSTIENKIPSGASPSNKMATASDVTGLQDNIIANTKLIKDTVGWSGKQLLPITLSKLKELNTGGTWVDNVYTFKGLTYTVAHDGDSVISITQTGTSTGTGYLFLAYLPLKNGDSFILNGSASNSSGTTTYMRVGKGGTEGTFVLSSIGGAETPVNISEDNNYSINIACGSIGITGTYVWKPMLRPANILDSTYEPYFGSTAFPRSEQAVLGAKNFLPNNNVTQTINGITFTKNADGSVTIGAGTASANTSYILGDIKPKAGNYILSRGTTNGQAFLSLSKYNGSTWVAGLVEIGNQAISEKGFTVDYSGYDTLRGFIYIGSGITISTPFTVYPMVRLASDPDDTYVPYAPINKELFPRSEQNLLGAKNQLPNTGKNETVNYVTFTNNSDGSITVNGTATAETWHVIEDVFTIPKGNYILTGCPNGGANDKFQVSFVVRNADNTADETTYKDYGDGVKVDIPADGRRCPAYIVVRNGQAINNLTFKPMLRPASDPDATYAPFAMNNKGLTDVSRRIQSVNIGNRSTCKIVPTDFANQQLFFITIAGSLPVKNGAFVVTVYGNKTGMVDEISSSSGHTITINTDGELEITTGAATYRRIMVVSSADFSIV